MIATLKAELRKVFSVRSTYFIIGIALLLELIFAFYIVGWHTDANTLKSSSYLSSQVLSAVNALNTILALVTLLLVTHEYRYNTIMFSLTASRSRTQVYLAKLLVVSGVALVLNLLFALLSPLLSVLAVHIAGLQLGHQDIAAWNLLWRSAAAGWGMSVFAFVFAMLIRVQVGAIVVLLIAPGTVESLLGLILKNNQSYLPFTSMNILLGQQPGQAHVSLMRALAVMLTYIVIGVVISWALFLKRDAN